MRGEACALLAPLVWSVAIVFYRRTDLAAGSMNLFKNTVAIALLSATLAVLGVPFPWDRSTSDWTCLIVSGLLGLAVADTLLLEGLRRIGAGGIAITDTAYAPVVVLWSWLFLGEEPSAAFGVGALAVVVGIGAATIQPRSLTTDWTGYAYAVTAIVCTASAVVLAKPVLEQSDLVEVTWTRLVAGVGGQLLWGWWRGAGATDLSVFRPSPAWWTLVPGAVLGAYVSMMLWLGGYKWADASVAAVLNQLGTVYILLQARFVLGEVLRPAQVLGALLAAGGALWIVWVG